jgi:putative sigma-54 modulation protein
MELTVRGHDLQISDELREFAARRTDGLDRLLDNIVDAKLELRRTHQRTSGGSIAAQITIQTGRNILRAEERDGDALRAVDLAINKIERQARRVHEKRSDRHGPRAGDLESPIPRFVADADDDETESVAKLVRRKRFSVKPMDPEEAIEQMELLGHDFYLFHNAEDSQLNVVYRRQDGTYGLLSPA